MAANRRLESTMNSLPGSALVKRRFYAKVLARNIELEKERRQLIQVIELIHKTKQQQLETEMSDEIACGQTTHTITLLRLGDSYRWQRKDGEWVSPTFSTPEAAYYAAGKIPFITDAEWKEFHPLPGDPSEIREHTPNAKVSDPAGRTETKP